MIYPKFDTTFQGHYVLAGYVKDGMEVQLLRCSPVLLAVTITDIAKYFPKVKEVTFHLPMNVCDIELVLANKDLKAQIICMIDAAKRASARYKLRINILAHSTWPLSMLKSAGLYGTLLDLVSLLEKTKVFFLLENTPTLLELPSEIEPSVAIVRDIDNKHLKACLDICHLHCIFNIKQKDLDFLDTYYTNDLDLSEVVHQVHFSATLENDGYKDKARTHSRPHANYIEAQKDIDILSMLNIADKPLVTEICEQFDSDWVNRDGQHKEILILNSFSA